MQRTMLVPSALTVSPRPTENEIRLKPPATSHQQRPEGGDGIG